MKMRDLIDVVEGMALMEAEGQVISVSRDILEAVLSVVEWTAAQYHSNFDKKLVAEIKDVLLQNTDQVRMSLKTLDSAKWTIGTAFSNTLNREWGALLKVVEDILGRHQQHPYIIRRVGTRSVFDGSRFTFKQQDAMRFPDHASAMKKIDELESKNRKVKLQAEHLAPEGTPLYTVEHFVSKWNAIFSSRDFPMAMATVDRIREIGQEARIVIQKTGEVVY